MKFAHLSLAALCAASSCLASFDPKDMDLSVKPQVDFYQYADGGWIRNNPIPADHSSWGGFDELQSANEAILHRILEKSAAAKKPDFIVKLVGDFYFSGMDLATVDAVGVAPLKPDFDRIAAIQSSAEVAAEVARLHRLGIGVCFGFGSEQDPKHSEMMIGGLGQGGLGLPDRDYYLRADADSAKLRDKYVAHVVRMLELAGDSEGDAQTQAQAIMRLETALAKGSKSDVDLRDPIANYHPMPLGEIEKLSPHFDWNAYFGGIGLAPPASIDVGQPEFLQALDAQIVATPVADWKAYFRWHLIHDNAAFVSTPFAAENFAFYGRTLTGTPQQRDRWRRVLSEIDDNAGEALGQLYVAEAFPPESKARMLKLVGNIRQALHDRIESLEWMDEATRKAAIMKLDAFGVKVGYPDKWIDYGKLVIDRGPYVLNVLRANEFNVQRDLAKIGKPVDRAEWGITPPTVNAYYNPSMNEIVFAAGILQPPFFDAKADDAVNYGGIGCVIGHEMTHGFDDQGRQYDGKGNLADWWSPESTRRFTLRSTGIVKQFSGYVAIDNLHVNGELTQGENIADLGGVKLSYAALMKTLAGKPVVKIDGFTPEQRFFLSFASIWRDNQRPEAVRLLVNTDPHSPPRFRVNGPLSNLDEFAAAFDVPEGSPMRRPAADRVTIW
jgi:predicted metalloendopeptidase